LSPAQQGSWSSLTTIHPKGKVHQQTIKGLEAKNWRSPLPWWWDQEVVPPAQLNTSSILFHWGRGVLETSDYILSTLWVLVYWTWNVSANNILSTFEMFPAVPGQTQVMGTFWSHLECNFNMFSTCDYW
jgi:hypothetical protein